MQNHHFRLDSDPESELSQDRDINAYHTVIKVLGAGGAGTNTIHHLTEKKIKEINTIAINTDAQDLLAIHADRKILIGKEITKGLGAGGDPEVGERAAEESKDILKTVFERTDILFLTCGLGGGTGTGSLPFIGGIAKELGILTVAIVTMPFSEEGLMRWENAQIGLEKLRKNVDTLIVLRNDQLIQLYPDLPISEAFNAGDEILINALTGLSYLIIRRGIINLDFADVSAVMRDGPNTVIGLGESDSENKVEEAVRRAISHPLMRREIQGAQSVLIHVTGGKEMTMREAHHAIKIISMKMDPSARIIWGINIEKDLHKTFRVLLIVSGLKEQAIRRFEFEKEVPISDFGTFSEKEEQITAKPMDNGRSIFDIKESIIAHGSEVTTQKKTAKPLTQTTLVFYKIFEEEAVSDLRRFDRAIHFLRKNPENRRALLDARQACKLLHASALMFGFDEVGHLLASIEDIINSLQSKEIKLSSKILDSITLAMEMVVDLIENRSDGKGETGYLVDRLKELKEEHSSFKSNDSAVH